MQATRLVVLVRSMNRYKSIRSKFDVWLTVVLLTRWRDLGFRHFPGYFVRVLPSPTTPYSFVHCRRIVWYIASVQFGTLPPYSFVNCCRKVWCIFAANFGLNEGCIRFGCPCYVYECRRQCVRMYVQLNNRHMCFTMYVGLCSKRYTWEVYMCNMYACVQMEMANVANEFLLQYMCSRLV